MEIKVKKNDLLFAIKAARLAIKRSVADDFTDLRFKVQLAKNTATQSEDGKPAYRHGVLEIAGTSAVCSIRKSVRCNAEAEAVFLVDPALFSSVLEKLPEETVTLDYDSAGNQVKVRTETFDGKFSTKKGKDFQLLEEGTEALALSMLEVQKAVRSTMHALDSDESKFNNLNAFYLEPMGSSFSMTVTDSHRVSSRGHYMDENPEKGMVIPGTMLRKVLPILPEDGTILKGKSTITFKGKDIAVTLLLNTMRYFNMASTRNPQPTMVVEVDRRQLAKQLEILTLIRDQAGVISCNGEQLKGKVRSEISDLKFTVNAVKHKGTGIRLGINIGYLLDAIKSLESETVTLEFTSPRTPVYIRQEDAEEVILPISLRE